MRKVFSAFLVASVLLLCAAPFSLAALAPFEFHTTQAAPVVDSSHWQFILASNDSDGVIVTLETSAIQYYVQETGSYQGVLFSSQSIPSIAFRCSKTGTYQVNLSYYDLKNGYLLSTESGSVTVGSSKGFLWYPNRIFALTEYVDFPVYCYALNGSHCSFTSSAGYNQVDPFVTWNSSGGGGGGDDPGPVDPTSVIRSLIPRPLGNNLVYYIADHSYLYSIYVAFPYSFESQGKIDTSLSPNEYEGENINVFSVMMSQSGSSSVQLKFTSRTSFPVNCYLFKYNVVDGSFVSSYSMTVSGGSFDTPSTHTYNLQLSDASTYGIYQSGFFSRDGITTFPELRISWSDTIDYSLDFFVVRQGLVTIVEGINATNSSLSTANSTLSSISSTSQQILAQIQSFYTLVSDYFTWFKSTFYDNLNQKWTFTNNYLVSIYNLLNETDETMTIEDDTSGVAAMESAKNDLVVTNAAGQAVDAGDAAAAGLSEAAQQIGEIAQPVGTINQLMQTIVFDKPKLLLPVIVALGLGLMVTILGKNKSD